MIKGEYQLLFTIIVFFLLDTISGFLFLAPDGNQYLNLGWEDGDSLKVYGF